MNVEFERIAVLRLGVMGGSLVRALASHARPSVVTGWSPDPSERHAAVAEGVVSAAPDQWPDAVADVDLVVLAMPLVATCELLGEVGAAAPPRFGPDGSREPEGAGRRRGSCRGFVRAVGWLPPDGGQ